MKHVLTPLDRFNSKRTALFQPPYGPENNGIACPKCGYELFDPYPNMVLTSNPLQKHVQCEGCGYRGYRVA